jgi:hypothetical protein
VSTAKKQPTPEFSSEDREREFWADHDSTEFVDWRAGRRRKFPNLKPTLLKVFLAERLKKERRQTDR